MINVSDVYDGMRVQVISIPDDSPDYTDLLHKFGSIEGEPFGDPNEEPDWVFVQIDGEKYSCEFKLSELTACVTDKESASELLKSKDFLWDGSKGYFARDNKDGTREVVELTNNDFSYISSYPNLNKIIR
jgi:hypothetical protein